MSFLHPVSWSSHLTEGSDGAQHRLHFLARNRYQLAGATIFGIVLPAMLRTGLHWGSGSMQTTLAGTFTAMLLGAYLLRRMTTFPGTQTAYYVAPVFLVSFGLAVTLFFFLRLDYSRLQFLMSFAFVAAWFSIVGIIEPALRRPRLVVLPFGAAQRVMMSDRADWTLARTSDALPTNATGVVVDLRSDIAPEWERFLARAALAGIPVYHWKQIAESLTGTVEIEHLSENTFGSLLPSSVYLRIKHLIDFALAIVSLPFVLAICAIAALAIWLSDGRPIFFRQKRIGLGGRPFTVFKFRTMAQDSADTRPFTIKNDPRITRVGRWLRRYRIDELPQVINILRGEMSWIGPRPEATELAEWYENEIPFYAYRHIVRPGISGWAQVHQGNVAEIKAASGKLQYDFYYIKYFSPWLDLLIAAKTVQILFTGHGAR